MKLLHPRRAAVRPWLPALLACAAGCALNHPTWYLTADAGARDAADDAALDAPREASVDAPTDVRADVIVDVATGADVTTDVALDASMDAATDAPADVTSDAPADVTLDAPADVAVDVSADVAVDVSADVAPDLACPTGYERCGDLCVDVTGDRNNCGRCGSACVSPETCISGACGCGTSQRQCGAACVSVLSDNRNCGACGNACALPETCFDGTCSCPPGRIVCGTGCVDPQVDNAHCGRCDNACGAGACATGVCGCSGGRRWCAGRCVDTTSDVANCGACANVCVASGATGAVCTAGACASAILCAAGRGNCNGNGADMCEVDTTTSVQHCGGCGRSCASSQRCAAGVCVTARSCNEVHTLWPALPTGQYDILPDGAAMTRVWCDMDTSGGGWTILYLWPAGMGVNVASHTLNYDVDLITLRRASTEVLVAYRNAARLVTDANWARLAIPADWVTQSPFRYDATDLAVMASIGGAPNVATSLRYGWHNFGNNCAANWDPSASHDLGRVCFNTGTAPFFNGFADMTPDHCPNSNVNWDMMNCADPRRFSIAVR